METPEANLSRAVQWINVSYVVYFNAKGKKRNFPRDVAIYLSRKLSHRSGKDLGQYFGNISGAAIVPKM